MRTIHVQGKLNLKSAIFLTVILVLIAFCLIYYVFTSDFSSTHTKIELAGLIGMISVFIPMWFFNADDSEEYVSELQLTNTELVLIYKRNKEISKTTRINLDNIKSIHAELTANNVITGRSTTLFCQTDVCITTKDAKRICFTENPTASLSFCNYSFMLRLLSIAKELPNFTFKVKGNSETTREDVKHFSIYGRRLSLLKFFLIEFKNYSMLVKITLIFAMLVFGFFIYSLIPNSTNKTDKEYIGYFDNASYYTANHNYENAIIEYEKAQQIHDDDPVLYEFKADVYYLNSEPQKAINTAQKGIECLKNKSTYYKVKNYKFIGKNDIQLYIILGENYQELKQYDKAEEAYTYVIEHDPKYIKAYFKRGYCRYEQSKPDAKEDFYKYKQLVEEYIAKQEQSPKNRVLYSEYSKKDVDQANKWLEQCENN
jgi:hypothetical protein